MTMLTRSCTALVAVMSLVGAPMIASAERGRGGGSDDDQEEDDSRRGDDEERGGGDDRGGEDRDSERPRRPSGGSKATRVYAFSAAGLDPEQADIPDALTHAVAHELHARVQPVSLEDAALALECDPDQRACLQAVLEQAEVDEIVYGTITKNMTGKLKVVLTVYSTDDAKQQKTYVISSRDAEEASDQLVQKAAQQLGIEDPEVTEGPVRGPKTGPVQGPITGPADTRSGIQPATYGLIGVGVVATAVGAGFIVSAQGIRNQVATAPDDTREQIIALQALENKGKVRAAVGYSLIGGGLLLGVIGIVRAMHEREPTKKADPTSDPTTLEGLSLAPVSGGGAAIVFSGSFQ